MDDNTILIFVIAVAGLLTAIGASIKHIIKCKTCCCKSDCMQSQEITEGTTLFPETVINIPTESPIQRRQTKTMDELFLNEQRNLISDTIRDQVSRSMDNLFAISDPINIPLSPKQQRKKKNSALVKMTNSDPNMN